MTHRGVRTSEQNKPSCGGGKDDLAIRPREYLLSPVEEQRQNKNYNFPRRSRLVIGQIVALNLSAIGKEAKRKLKPLLR